MKLNYKKIGELIKKVNNRNNKLDVTNLMGINIDKFFMPSVANTIGTDMSKYKIVKKGQFACNRMHVGRDKRIPIALSNEDDIIVSPAYDVFEIKNQSLINPEYLMMLFLNEKFDRQAWFYTDADVRGGLKWEDFCNIKVPVPSIEKQKEIVNEYNTVINRINFNELYIKNLENTAQTILKRWFVDFDFPNQDNIPYKSSGGDMEYNSEVDMEIPKGWVVSKLGNLIEYKKGFAFKSDDYVESGRPIIRVSDFNLGTINMNKCYYLKNEKVEEYSQYMLKTNDIIISTVGSWPNNPFSLVGQVVMVHELADGSLLNQNAVRLRGTNGYNQFLLYFQIANKEFSRYVLSGAQGSANQASVTLEHLFNFNILVPHDNMKSHLNSIFDTLGNKIMIKRKEIFYLEQLKNVILSKL